MTTDHEQQPTIVEPDSQDGVTDAPSDNDTVTGVLDSLRADGFEADLRPADDQGNVVCDACGEVSPAAELTDIEQRRLEGASDPGDMVLAIGARCPACQALGAMVLGYGPQAGAEDAGVVAELP